MTDFNLSNLVKDQEMTDFLSQNKVVYFSTKIYKYF